MSHEKIEQLNNLLPQTQCGLCDHKGCKPYAKAMIMDNAPIDRCPPGGIDGLKKIARYLNKDPQPFIKHFVSKEPSIVYIEEDACIGCTKCIQACPVDAIVGAAKQMHTVIADHCTGCDLCISPCPVDCITIIPTAANIDKTTQDKEHDQSQQAMRAKQRFEAREARHHKAQLTKKQKHEKKRTISTQDKQAAIQNALARYKKNKG